ncbi:helix-turn-helix transcriptional regulator [Streptomyces viridiviolaceus]
MSTTYVRAVRAGYGVSADSGPALPELRGRKGELAALTGLLEGVEQGQAGLSVIEGAQGSGKTRLLEEVRRTAERRGLHVFHGSADPDGHDVPLGPLLRAFTSGNEPLFDVHELRRLKVLPNPGFWLLQEMHERLERAAMAAPLVVLVDDVQRCDETSLMALRNLPGRLAGYPVAWLLTVRTSPMTGAGRSTVSRLVAGGGRWVRLGPLDDEAVEEFVGDLLGAVPDGAVLKLAATAEGRPLLLRELCEGLKDEGALTVCSGRALLTGSRTPRRFQASVRHHLSQLSDRAGELARLASALDDSCPVDLMAELLDVPLGSLMEPLRELLATGLVVEDEAGVAFRHDQVREAVAGLTTPTRRQRLRRRAVDLRLARGAPVTDVAVMLSDSAEPGDRAAVTLLTDAAAELAARSPATAAELNIRAMRLLPGDDPARPRMIAETVSWLWRGGNAAQALAMAETALRQPHALDPESEARLRLELAGLTSRRSFTEAARHARMAVGIEGAPAGLTARSLALLAVNLTRSGTLDEARRTAHHALELAREAGQPAAEAMALAVESTVAYVHADWHRSHDAADRAVLLAHEDGAGETFYEPAMWRVTLHSRSGYAQQAVDQVDDAIRLARRRGQAATMHFWSTLRSRLLLEAGRLEEARAEAKGVLAMAEDLGSANLTDTTVRYPLGIVALHTGNRAAVRTAIRDAATMMRDESEFVRRFGAWLAAQVADWEGDSRRALALLPPETEIFDTVRPKTRIPFDAMDQPVFVRIALRAGDLRRATEAAAVARHRAEASPAFPALAAAAAHAQGLVAQDAQLLKEAVELCGAVQRPLALASANEDTGRALVRCASPQATRYLDTALRLYEQCGAGWHAARVRRLLTSTAGKRTNVKQAERAGRARGGATGWAALSPGELQVVRLVAAGRTNREVAVQLFVSPHTISTYVRRAFKKLGINSRVELVRIAMEEDAERQVS